MKRLLLVWMGLFVIPAHAAIPNDYAPVVVEAPFSLRERVFDLTSALETAKSTGKPIFLYLGAKDCPPCLEYKRFLSDHRSELKEAFSEVVVVDIRTWLRGPSMYLKVKEILSKGWIGKVSHYECQYNRNSDWRKPVNDPKMERAINWRMYKEYCGGVLSELSAHEIDIVNWMQDSHPLKVAGFGGIDYWKDGRETFDNIRLVYEYPGGVKASVTSILSNEYKGYSIRILGSKGTIEILRDQAYIYPEASKKTLGTVDGVTGATMEVLPGGKGQKIVFEQQTEPTTYSLQDFAECILKGKKPASNVNTGRDVAIAVHMGNQAAETEKTQYWKDEYSV